MKKAFLGVMTIGGVIGVLNLAHYYAAGQVAGVERPFGIFPGGFPFAAVLGLTGRKLSPELRVMLVLGLGILCGSLLSARLSGDFTIAKLRQKRLSKIKATRAAVGGVLMGAGTWMAQGCLVKHTLSGAPGLMLSSWLTLAGIVAGIWACGWVEERRN